MWVWDVTVPMSPEASQKLVDFCSAKNIDLLYLAAFAFNERRAMAYRSFNALAHKHNIKVHALAGDPRWCMEKYHRQPLAWVAKVLEYNKQTLPEERFDGVHIDAEPYTLGKPWEQQHQLLLQWYLDLNQKLADLVATEGNGIILGADIPFWYDDDISMTVEWRGSLKPASHHVLDVIDAITIMDYRNFAEGPNGSIELARREIEYADKVGKKVYIGQETKTDVYPEYVTFGNLDEVVMKREVKKLIETYRKHPSFAGIAIHHYHSYRRMINEE
jgi:hypothetical protein